MKQTPELAQAQRRMRPGIISRDGFLGTDWRPLRAIIEEDDSRVGALGLTHAAIAERLRYFTQAARARLGAAAVVDKLYQVRVYEVRGKIHCPWDHPGGYGKCLVYLRRLDTGEDLTWTDLHIHMIEAHGFYEGTGSTYRLSPARLKRVLGLGQAPSDLEVEW